MGSILERGDWEHGLVLKTQPHTFNQRQGGHCLVLLRAFEGASMMRESLPTIYTSGNLYLINICTQLLNYPTAIEKFDNKDIQTY
jgi:hypothetical protein